MTVKSTAHIRLRTARIAQGYPSAKLFAEKNGLSYTTYISHENGKNEISPKFAKIYADLLKLPEDWLLHGITEPHKLDHPSSNQLQTKLQALLPVWLPKIMELYLKSIGKNDPSINYNLLFTKAHNTFMELAKVLDDIDTALDKTATICALREDELKEQLIKPKAQD